MDAHTAESDVLFDPAKHAADERCAGVGCPNVAQGFAYFDASMEDGDYFCNACVTSPGGHSSAGAGHDDLTAAERYRAMGRDYPTAPTQGGDPA